MRIGELFSGYGGLGLGVQAALGGDVVWHSEYDRDASKILAHHWPDIPNHGDITTIDWSSVEPVDVLTGGSPCFPSGTLIDTTEGYRPIETIRLGDSVRTHRERYMSVVQLMRRMANDTVAVKVMGAPEFVTTAEHPFYTRVKGRAWNNERRQYDRTWSEPGWTQAAFLTTDHFVGFQIDQRDETVPSIGTDLAHLIGRWLGDGWLRNTLRTSAVPSGHRGSRIDSRWWHVFICCAHEEADELAAVIRRAGFEPHPPQIQRTATRFRIGSKALVKLLSEFGSGAGGKRIPGWVYRLPVEEQAALWQGWVDSDGSTQPLGQVRVTTVSEELAHGMARVARNAFRRAVSVHRSKMPPTCVIEGRVVNQRDQFQVVLPVGNREAFIEGNWCWTPVRSVRDADPCEVFNFGVAEDESYTAWGITVHNCQDLSHAGKRGGMTEGTRSNLWVAMREAIAYLRPRLVVWENVRGALSAEATCDVESREGLLGTGRPGPYLRAAGRVLGDLAELGYDSRMRGLRAADVGAPHGRFRVFVCATDSTSDAGRIGDRDSQPAPDAESASAGSYLPTRGLSPQPRGMGRTPRRRLAGQTAPDTGGKRHGRGLHPRDVGPVDGDDESQARQRQRPVAGDRGATAAADTASRYIQHDPIREASPRSNLHQPDWGQYAPAIARWANVLGRPAPPPTELGRHGAARLSPRFVEWMMGLPAGHVTDVDISRNAQLKALGNGVVPQQAEAALRHLLLARAA